MTVYLAWGWILFGVVAAASPPGSADDSSRQLVDLGWEETFESVADWREEPWLAAKPAMDAAASVSPEGFEFFVRSAHSERVWTRTANPIWVLDFPFLELEYTVSGSPVETGEGGEGPFLFSDDSTGPVTPGALNPENPLASGSDLSLGAPENGHHKTILDLREDFSSDRIGRISVHVRSGEGPARVGLHRLAFWSADPRTEWEAPSDPTGRRDFLAPIELDRSGGEGNWKPILLPDGQSVSRSGFERVFNKFKWPDRVTGVVDGIPFRLKDEERAALATGIQAIEDVTMEADLSGSELALLLAVRRFGSSRPWYSKNSAYIRDPLISPHELCVELEYADARRRIHFPRSASTEEYRIDEGPCAYVVPLEPGKRLASIRLRDKMNYGQLFLLAASLNEGTPTLSAKREDSKVADDSFPHPNESLLSTIGDGAKLIQIRDSTGNLVSLADTSLTLRLKLERPGDGEVRLTPTLVSSSPRARTFQVVYPLLENIRIASREEDAAYLLGTRNTLLGTGPIEIEEPYGGGFPLQFMDLYDRGGGGGFGIWIEDRDLNRKTFRFRQEQGNATLSVRYDEVRLAPGESKTLPTAVLLSHSGDWHEPFHRYREWVRSGPSGNRKAKLKNLFFCRRDYPVGGTGYLYDLREIRYTPGRLSEESIENLGGIDLIDISGWAYNENTGRVGDYLKNDLGGLPELAHGVEVAHASGTRVGLYFEGYLLDKRCELAKRALPDWQLVGKGGKGRWWNAEMEFFACPGVAEWRETFSGMVAEVAKQSNADAVYVDQFGFSGRDKACYSPDHGHPVPSNPLKEERLMLEAVRERLDEKAPDTAIYTEQVPADGFAHLTDAAFNYGMAVTSSAPKERHPTQLPLHRFVFPEIAVIEMVGHGIRPPAVAVDDLHLCLFHGLAVWLKGRGESWFSPQFRELARKIYPIFREYSDLFRSPDCEPLIPTLMEGVYANRFGAGDRALITVYNSRPSDIEGELVEIEGDYRKTTDLLSSNETQTLKNGERVVIAGRLEPKSARVFLLER